METIHKQFFENTKAALPVNGERQKWLTMATESPDRAGDIMILAGMDATNFKKNPQFIWQHGQSGAEVNTIGKILDLQVVSGALLALAEFATPDVSELAEDIFKMASAGLLPANSIGFRPIEWEGNDTGGHTFKKWELIECSKVELPMNPEAIDKSLESFRKNQASLSPEVIRKVGIELSDPNVVIKEGRTFASENEKALRAHVEGLREHANGLNEKADALEKLLDNSLPEKKEEPYKSVPSSATDKVSTRRLKNRALLKLKQHQHD